MVPLKKLRLVHEVSNRLLAENHHIIAFDLEGHARLTNLSINKQFATLILKDFALLCQILRKVLDLLLEESGEPVELGGNYHLDEFELILLSRELESDGAILRGRFLEIGQQVQMLPHRLKIC